MTVIPMHASCPSVDCSAPLNSGRRGRRGRRPTFASATCVRSTKNRYTVSESICVANVTAWQHSAGRRCVPTLLAQDRTNFASIFTPSKTRWKLPRRKRLRCKPQALRLQILHRNSKMLQAITHRLCFMYIYIYIYIHMYIYIFVFVLRFV